MTKNEKLVSVAVKKQAGVFTHVAKFNNTNNASKRTATQVKAILTSAGFDKAITVENTGNGRNFCVGVADTINMRMRLKSLGFILERSNGGPVTYISCF
jgi:hypothetical protein